MAPRTVREDSGIPPNYWIKNTTNLPYAKAGDIMLFTQDYVQAILDYNPYTGVCLWKSRPRTDFKLAHKRSAWNNSHVGEEVGTVDPSTTRLRVSLFSKTHFLDQLVWIYVYGEQPTAIYHVNGWNVDNSLNNLSLEKSQAPTRYSGGELILMSNPADTELNPTRMATHGLYSDDTDIPLHLFENHKTHLERYLILSDNHCLGVHSDTRTARTHLLELCEYLQCSWQDLTAPSPISHKYRP